MKWSDILAETRAAAEQWRREGSMPWYRGHVDVSWRLKSKLHRSLDTFFGALSTRIIEDEKNAKRHLLREEYKTLYLRFNADAWPLLDPRERSDWGVVFAMQHYGQSTRLLDWTGSFACATYFALLRSCEHADTTKDAAIWMLDPHTLNREVGIGGLLNLEDLDAGALVDTTHWHPKLKPPQEDLYSIAVAPKHTNARMTAQRSFFTVSGDSFAPLDEEYSSLAQTGRLRQFILDADERPQAAAFLEAAGVDDYTFFPDLYGLALRHSAESARRLEDGRRWYPKSFKPIE